jgi:hypothetical protein
VITITPLAPRETIDSCRSIFQYRHTFYIVLVDKIQWVSEEAPSKLSPPPETFPPSNGTPSTTMSGPLPERIEVFPRTLIETPLPGSPLDCVTCTPATLPLNNCAGEGEATLSKSSAPI